MNKFHHNNKKCVSTLFHFKETFNFNSHAEIKELLTELLQKRQKKQKRLIIITKSRPIQVGP